MKTYLLIGLLLLSQLGFTQLKKKSFLDKPDISSSVTVGTTLGNNYSNGFIAPNIHQTINSKLSLNYGAVLTRGSSNYVMIDNYGFGYVMPSSTNSFYVDGTYKISNKITVKSTIIVENSNYDGFETEMNNFKSNMYMMGIEYKISDAVRIQAEIGLSQGQHPYSHLLNPYYQRPFSQGISPFYSPFVGY